ncbi:uncharacterized protein LDX57_011683 [Aspergillus melleus]|uniref:uncharacterized protein n=1 Tax=Aspergillus melleus TaxID=138277 RepID=UPI001E8DB182|nr:uncharacterized protein LDX57_011683 [Aspergillus melleus]KAH8434046.1 hypothetical protein LDX57_011683 [Aspergillus melleus]
MTPPSQSDQKRHSRWIILALTSGAFAALNGLFAKLTTDTHTSSLAAFLLSLFNATLDQHPFMELVIRGIFFGLNLLSNVTMWALFTRALTASPSTTKVSITNTSANFLVTAVLGMLVFKENVAPLWWVGAGLMGGGCVLVGMRDQ